MAPGLGSGHGKRLGRGRAGLGQGQQEDEQDDGQRRTTGADTAALTPTIILPLLHQARSEEASGARWLATVRLRGEERLVLEEDLDER